jgi:hypothetical protein
LVQKIISKVIKYAIIIPSFNNTFDAFFLLLFSVKVINYSKSSFEFKEKKIVVENEYFKKQFCTYLIYLIEFEILMRKSIISRVNKRESYLQIRILHLIKEKFLTLLK